MGYVEEDANKAANGSKEDGHLVGVYIFITEYANCQERNFYAQTVSKETFSRRLIYVQCTSSISFYSHKHRPRQ